MIVYHGTTGDHAERILTEGLAAGTCVTSDENLAWYYAECAADEAITDDPWRDDVDEVVLEVHVTDSDLCCDHAALEEPVGWGGRTGSQIEQQIADDLAGADHRTFTAATSLKYTASARVTELVPADRIRRLL